MDANQKDKFQICDDFDDKISNSQQFGPLGATCCAELIDVDMVNY